MKRTHTGSRSATPPVEESRGWSRRAVLGSAGASLLAVAGTAHPNGAPYPTSIASTPISGRIYKVACMYELHPFPAGVGYLKVYAADEPEPAASALNFRSDDIANALVVGVSAARKIKIFASEDVHVIVDITGTVG